MLLKRRWAALGTVAPWVTLAGRLILGPVFIAAGLTKLGDPLGAAEAVQAYQILPARLATLVGYGVPLLGIALGILLVAGLATRLVAVLLGLHLVVYIAGIVSLWARGISIDCGCFGGGGPVALGHTQYSLDILCEAGLLALAVIVAAWAPGRFAIDRALGLRASGADLAGRRLGESGAPQHDDSGPPPHRRPSGLLNNAGVLILILVVAAAGTLVQRNRAATETTAYLGPYAPVTRTADDTMTMAQPGVTKPVLVIYEDYQCSICDEFELANGGPIQKLADQGRVKIVYHLFTIFVGSQPRQGNSTRAWAAAECVPAGTWVKYHNLLYLDQPAETAENGFPVAQLLAFGRRMGLTDGAFIQCVTSQRYAARLVPLSNQIFKSGINATPTVTLNGRPLNLATLVSPNGALSQAITAAP